MKIIHIIPNLKRGGAERICIDICKEQNKQGHKSLIVTFENGNDFKELVEDISIQIIPTKFVPSIIKKNTLEIEVLEKFILDFAPDIIHSHLYAADLITFQLSDKVKCKFFSHLHSKRKELNSKIPALNTKEKIIRRWEKRFYIKLLKQKKVKSIAISKDVYSFAKEDLKQNENNCVLLENCINFNTFKSTSKKLNSPIKLIALGTINKNKSQTFLIESFAYLSKENFTLTIIGDGPEFENCLELVRSQNLSENIFLLGAKNNPEDFLKDAHIFVHAAKSEAFGLSLIEAMAAGLPVVTTDGYGNRDIIKEGKNGFVIWERNPQKFADKIKVLIDSPKLYNEMSKNAIEFASNFDVKPYCEKLLEIYKS